MRFSSTSSPNRLRHGKNADPPSKCQEPYIVLAGFQSRSPENPRKSFPGNNRAICPSRASGPRSRVPARSPAVGSCRPSNKEFPTARFASSSDVSPLTACRRLSTNLGVANRKRTNARCVVLIDQRLIQHVHDFADAHGLTPAGFLRNTGKKRELCDRLASEGSEAKVSPNVSSSAAKQTEDHRELRHRVHHLKLSASRDISKREQGTCGSARLISFVVGCTRPSQKYVQTSLR
jgi:hypothetical protein